MNQHQHDHELLHRYLDGCASTEETQELFERIIRDPNFADRFRDVAEIDALIAVVLLEDRGAQNALAVAKSLEYESAARRNALGLLRWKHSGLAAAAVVVMCGLLAMWWGGDTIRPATAAPAIARLLKADACQWDDGSVHPVGGKLRAGIMALSTGLAEIKLDCGTILVLEAPLTLELIDERQVLLHSGNIVVRTSGVQDRFQLHTTRATVQHLGTEFGVRAVEGGGVVIQVFEGVVTADWKGDLARVPQSRVAAGEALRLDSAPNAVPQAVPFREERFVRTLPELEEFAFRGEPPRNVSQIEIMHIRPVSKPVVVDGDLSEWDLSKQFLLRLQEPYDKDYFVAGAMMADAQAIYIAAHVGDPFPLRSVMEAEVDPEYCWKGGSVQVRLATDRDLTWPLVGCHPHDRSLPTSPATLPSPQDTSDQLVHLTMWYHRPSEQPKLIVQHGMDLHSLMVNPTGFKGAFRCDADGRGYTMEYVIPWSLLNAMNPPQPGDTLASCWQIHWSDQTGRRWRGHMVANCRPGIEGHSFRNAAMWGRAIYDSR